MLREHLSKFIHRLNSFQVVLGVFLLALMSYVYVKVVDNPISLEVFEQIQNHNPTDEGLLGKNRMQVLFMQERGWFFLVFACLVISLILWIGLFNRVRKKRTYQSYRYKLTESLNRNFKDGLNFQDRLYIKYDNLTPNDLLIAEMLLDGFSSKEISGELNISQASANTARYRLRKKLQLSHETDLLLFLRNI